MITKSATCGERVLGGMFEERRMPYEMDLTVFVVSGSKVMLHCAWYGQSRLNKAVKNH